jgi:nitrite reductase/ring-hydroxylating ferredoxin subunit
MDVVASQHDALVWTDVGSEMDLLSKGRLVTSMPSGRVVAVFARATASSAGHGGVQVSAIDSACYHHGGPLVDGAIEDLGGAACVSCPWHKYRIGLDSGESFYESLLDMATKATVVKSKGVKQRVHPAMLRGGRVYVCDSSRSDIFQASAGEAAGVPVAADLVTALGTSGAATWQAMQAATAAAGGALESDRYATQVNNSTKFACPGDRQRAEIPALHSAFPIHSSMGPRTT